MAAMSSNGVVVQCMLLRIQQGQTHETNVDAAESKLLNRYRTELREHRHSKVFWFLSVSIFSGNPLETGVRFEQVF